MPKLIVSSATLDLTTSSDWSWVAPPQVVVPPVVDSILNVGGLNGILPSHLSQIVATLSPAIQFNVPDSMAGAPGTLKITELNADEISLSQHLTKGSEKFLTESTTGTFKASVVAPATNAAPSPVGPPIGGTLNGTWSVKETKQEIVRAQ